MTTTEIWGWDVEPRIGRYIIPDNWAVGGLLIEGDDFSPMRITTNNGIITSLACRVETTGRTLQRRHSDRVVRVRITFLGDGEPDTVSGGYMVVPW